MINQIQSFIYRVASMLQWSFKRDIATRIWHRAHSTVAVKKVEECPRENIAYENARPFSEIPGPSTFDFMRGLLPGGAYYKQPVQEWINIMHDQYGDMYKFKGFLQKEVYLMTFDPEIYRTIYRNEGIWPVRPNFATIDYHRQVHRKDFFQGLEGLLSSGESWNRSRSALNPILLNPKNAKLYFKKMLDVNDDFILKVRKTRDPVTNEVPEDFENVIHRLAFESVSVVALNKSLGLLRQDQHHSEVERFFQNSRDQFILANEIESSLIPWKLYKTKKFHKLMKISDDILETLMKRINEAIVDIEKNSNTPRGDDELSVIEKLLKIDKRLAIITAMDLFFAGIDVTSATFAAILLVLAKNPEKQRLLREELRTVLPKKDSVLTADQMKNLPYLRAVIKEVIRLHPPVPHTARVIPTNLVLGGYQVPKGVCVLVASSVLMKYAKYFPEPDKFLPERWLRDPTKKDDRLVSEVSSAFAYLPFGFGPRSCAGKRLVDQILEIATSRLVRNFEIGFNYPVENAFELKVFMMPVIPLKFSFTEVKD